MKVILHKPDPKPVIHNPVVLITGDGMSLPADVKAFRQFGIEHDLYCIARSYQFMRKPLDHWADVDGETSIWWAENLPVEWRNGPQRHTLGEMRGFDFDWDCEQSDYNMDEILWHGSTSLFATLTAVEMGYEMVVLAGCPLDANGHWYLEPKYTGPRWTGECYQAWLDFSTQPEAKKVRSLSGYTKIILGEPTIKCLRSYQ